MKNFTTFESYIRANKTRRWLGLLTFFMMLFGYSTWMYGIEKSTTKHLFSTSSNSNPQLAIDGEGETCGDPLTITSLPYTHTANTATYGNNYVAADVPPLATGAVTNGTGANSYLIGFETVYSITPSISGVITINTTNDDGWQALWVFTNCPFTSTVGYHTAISGTTRTIANLPVVANQTYFIVFSSWDPPGVQYTITVTGTEGLLTPPEDCTGIPDGGTAVLTPNSGNSESNFTATATGVTLASSLEYQWQKFVGGTWQDIAGATTKTSTITSEAGDVGDTTDYRLKVTCTASSEVAYSTTATYTISLVYCTPTGASNNTDEIRNFTLNNLNNSSAASEGTAGYMDYSGIVAPAIVAAGVPTVASLTSGGGSGNHGAAIWIDYNQNGTFEASEKVTYIATTITPNSTVNFPEFTIPETVTPGIYRLRVQYRHNISGELLDPCVASQFAETEDYAVNILEAPTCLPPSGLNVSNITSSSVDIAWVSPGTTFEILWGEAGFDVTSEGEILSFISGETLTGLDALTAYQIYVRQDCGDDDLSPWAGPISFTSGCGTVTTLPYVENFDTYGTGTNAFPVCWERPIIYSGFPSIVAVSLAGLTSAPNSLRFQSQPTDPTYAISPAFAEDLHNLRVKFNLRREGANSGTMDIGVMSDPTDFSTFEVVYTINPTDNVFHPYAFNLDTTLLSGGDNYIAFRHNSVLNNWYYWVDDFTVELLPPCPEPSLLTANNIDHNSAELGWLSSGTDFDIKWGATGFDVETEGELVTDFTNGGTLTGLAPLTTYQFYVRQNCSDDGTSVWAGPISFTTACGVLTPPTATQNFTGFTGAAPATLQCWSEATGTLDNPLTGTTSSWTNQVYNTNINSSHPNGTAAYINLYGVDNEWLITPAVDLGDGSIPYQMEYDVSITPWTGVGPLTDMGEKSVQVVISTDGGATWSSGNVLHTYDNNDIPAGGREDAIVLTGYTGVVKFAFYAHSTATTIDTRFYIDNWRVVPVPTCPKPTFLGVSNITYESAELTWTSDGSLFDIEYGLAGFTPTGEPSDGLTGLSNNYTLTGLTPETSYQYYVRQDCGDDDLSVWAGPYSFFTGYCLATSTGTGNRITGFATTDGYTNIDNLNNGTSSGYNNYSNMVVTQSEGNTFNYTITVPANTVVDIWIDIDHNLIFDPVDELLAIHDALTTTYNGSFTIPMGLPLGDYRLRLRSRSNTAASNPCGSLANGETEDYTLTIIETPNCLPPTGIGADNITYDSAELFWTLVDGTSFDIEFGEAGFEPTGEPSPDLAEVSNPYTLTGLTPLTNYEYYVRHNCGGIDGESIWVGPYGFKTECLPPTITGTTAGEVCGMGEVTLSATTEDGATIAWYDSETEGNKLAEGETFTTPVISETTSYWVAAYSGDGVTTGQAKQTFTGTSPGGYTLTAGLEFVATDSFTLVSVVAYSYATTGTTIPSIQLQTASGTMIQEITNVAIPNGATGTAAVPFTIDLNFEVPGPGTYRLMAVGSFSSLARDSGATNAAFPHPVGDVAQITQGILTADPATSYYYFYDWTIGGGCSSDRIEVVATVTSAPTLELSTNEISICEGETPDTVTITAGASDYDTFVWEPATGVTGDATTGWSFSPAETTTYTLTASQTSGAMCATTTTLDIIINPLPTAITVVGDEQACVNSISTLTVEGNIVNGTAIFGTGTTAPAATTWPNPLSAFYGGAKHQMLYTASELSAQGLIQGSEITAVTLDIAAVNTTNGALVDFTIRMGATSVTEMTGLVTGTSDVYGPATFTPSTVGIGIVSFTLTTPYVWDGVSNLIVETVHNSGNTGNGSGTTTRTSPTPNNSVYRVAKDNVAGGVPGFDATTYTVVGAHNIRPNMTFTHSMEQTMITWEPATNLYTDAAATVPYVSGEYAQVVYFKPTTQGNVTYTATSSTEFGCTVSDAITIAVGPAIVAPTGATTQTLENGDTLADLVVNGTNLVWYADAALTQAIPNTTQVVDGTTYYVVTESGACQSASLAITVIIDPCTMLATPTGNTAQSVMLGDTIAELDVTGTNLVWYADANLTTVIPNTTVAVNGTTYYVVATTEDCQSAALAITVTVIDPCADVVTPTGAATQTVLVGATIASLVVDGNNLVWYADEDLTTVLPETTLLVNGATYYVVAETAECQSGALAITVTVIDPCAEVVAPTGDAVQIVAEGTTLAELEVNGTSLAWYADAELTQSLVASTIVEHATTYYVASVTDICQSEPLAITVYLEGTDPCEGVTIPAPTGNAEQVVGEGTTLAELIVEGENLQWYADADLTEELEDTTVVENNMTYYVTQTIGLCTSAEALAVTVQVTVGREDFESFAFRFYPNPVGDVLNLTSNSEISQINLFNMLGQKVTVVANANNTQVDMSGLPTGNYIITVTIEGVTKTFKVVKN